MCGGTDHGVQTVCLLLLRKLANGDFPNALICIFEYEASRRQCEANEGGWGSSRDSGPSIDAPPIVHHQSFVEVSGSRSIGGAIIIVNVIVKALH